MAFLWRAAARHSSLASPTRLCIESYQTGRSRWLSTSPRRLNASQPNFPGALDSTYSQHMQWNEPAMLGTIPTYRILNASNRIEDPSQITSRIPPEEILTWYKNMLTINIMDNIMFEAQRHGRLSFYMVSAGEEAAAIGSAAALDEGDVITCQYREQGVFLQRGWDLKDFMNQLAANCNDPGKGRSMPVHYTGKTKTRIHTVSCPLGTQIPQSVGAAYALKVQDRQDPTSTPRVAVTYFGEGASSEGDFHAALNMASTMQAPVIFICRNNGYAISTPASEQYRGDGICSRGAGYGIETLRVDGTDIFAVYEATKEARRRALQDGGRPVLLEFMSYRISHHSTSDDSSAYRSRDEVDYWKSSLRNPLARLRQWLEVEGLWSEQQEEETRRQLRKDVIRELAQAEEVKKPALRSMFTDVYAEVTEEMEDQREELRQMMMKYPGEYDVDEHLDGIHGL